MRKLGSAGNIEAEADVFISLPGVVETTQRPADMVDHVIQGHRGGPEEIAALQGAGASPGLGLGRENPGFRADIKFTVRAVHQPKLDLIGDGGLRIAYAPQRSVQPLLFN